MPDNIKVLIVEDDDDLVEIYTDTIRDHNEDDENLEIVPTFAHTYEEAKKYIQGYSYDSAFIDLCITPDEPSEKKGKELIIDIKAHAKYPVYIVSGLLDGDTAALAENKFISEHEKGSENAQLGPLFKEVDALYKTGITKVLNAEGFFATHLRTIFWDHFSQSKEYWLAQHDLSGTELEKSISRYTLSHLYEYLETNDQGGSVKYDSSEMYICPVIKQTLSPGDVVEVSGEYKLVLTPACSLANNIHNVILADLVKLFELQDVQTKKSRGNVNNLSDLLNNYLRNKKGDHYHFLPKFLDFDAHLVDFREVETVSYTEAISYTRKMSIALPHLKDIQARFSAYYARQGSPDFEFKSLSDKYADELINV